MTGISSVMAQTMIAIAHQHAETPEAKAAMILHATMTSLAVVAGDDQVVNLLAQGIASWGKVRPE